MSANCRSYRGSENDVLSRYVEAARECHADVVVRITSDCPLIDATVTDRVIRALVAGPDQCDYAVISSSVPTREDWMSKRSRWRRSSGAIARQPHRRIGNTSPRSFDATEPECSCVGQSPDSADNSDLRWTVDTPGDLELVRRIYRELDLVHRQLTYDEILTFVRSRPDLVLFNLENKTWDPIEGGTDGRD